MPIETRKEWVSSRGMFSGKVDGGRFRIFVEGDAVVSLSKDEARELAEFLLSETKEKRSDARSNKEGLTDAY